MKLRAALPAVLGCALLLGSSATMEQRAGPPSMGDGEHAAAPPRAKTEFTREEVSRHNSRGDFWGVVDGYVLDLTGFVDHHPGGVSNIMSVARESDFSFARGANAHFGATASAFREACRAFDGSGEPGFEFTFQNSRKNGGLDNSGRVTGHASAPVGTVKFVGRLSPS